MTAKSKELTSLFTTIATQSDGDADQQSGQDVSDIPLAGIGGGIGGLAVMIVIIVSVVVLLRRRRLSFPFYVA